MNFNDFLKSNDKLKDTVEKMKAQESGFTDERIWRPKTDKSGNYDGVIRFCSQKDTSKFPIVTVRYHNFTNPKTKKKFYCLCRWTLKEPCPICEFVKPFWAMGEAAKKEQQMYGSKKSYYCNIRVVNDLAVPENNGKVMIYKFGKQVWDKIDEKLSPKSKLDTFVNVLHFVEGRNLKLKVREVDDWPSYVSSEFYSEVTPIADTMEEMEQVFNQLYDLNEFVDPKKFGTYEEVKRKFIGVVGKPAVIFFNDSAVAEEKKEEKPKTTKEEESDFDFNDSKETKKEEKPAETTASKTVNKEVEEVLNSDDGFDFGLDDDGSLEDLDV